MPQPYDPINRPTGQSGKLAERIGQISKFTGDVAGPTAISRETQQLFQLLQSSPAFASMLRSIMGSGARTEANVAGALGRAGAGTTGIGAISRGVSQSVTGARVGAAQGQLFQGAMQTALESLMQRLQILPALLQERRMLGQGGPKTFLGKLSGGRVGN